MQKLEKDIEYKVNKFIKDELYGYSIKLYLTGWPDRLVLLPKGTVFFIEYKRPGKKPRKLQEFIHGLLREYGFTVMVIDNYETAVKEIVNFYAA